MGKSIAECFLEMQELLPPDLVPKTFTSTLSTLVMSASVQRRLITSQFVPWVQEFAALDAYVVAEGRFRTPDEAGEAISCGANSVVIGSAITRIENVTGWFSDAIEDAGS